MQAGSATTTALILVSFLAAGCQTGSIYSKPHQAYVQHVAVSKATTEGSAGLADEVRTSVLASAATHPRLGRPKCLEIRIVSFHLKNPALSLLVGDSNRLNAEMEVIDAGTGSVDAKVPVMAINSYALNGVIGAAQAISQDAGQAERRLIDDFGLRVAERIYGPAGQKPRPIAAQAPVQSPPGAAAASAPACR